MRCVVIHFKDCGVLDKGRSEFEVVVALVINFYDLNEIMRVFKMVSIVSISFFL